MLSLKSFLHEKERGFVVSGQSSGELCVHEPLLGKDNNWTLQLLYRTHLCSAGVNDVKVLPSSQILIFFGSDSQARGVLALKQAENNSTLEKVSEKEGIVQLRSHFSAIKGVEVVHCGNKEFETFSCGYDQRLRKERMRIHEQISVLGTSVQKVCCPDVAGTEMLECSANGERYVIVYGWGLEFVRV